MSAWRYSGFGVNFQVRLGPGDVAGRERLLHYMLGSTELAEVRCPFSLERMIRVTPEGKVLYVAEKKAPRRFPGPASNDLFGDAPRRSARRLSTGNFQLFDPLDFIAELTQHIPDARKHLGRAFGFYSNRTRGRRAKAGRAHGDTVQIDDQHTPGPLQARRRWAALIKQVWRVDPLTCSRCGSAMRIVAFIGPAQRAVIEKLLGSTELAEVRHRGLWTPHSRAPPAGQSAAPAAPPHAELRFVPDPEFVDAAPPDPVWTPD
jgi:hypothetical protein